MTKGEDFAHALITQNISEVIHLSDLPEAGGAILKGQVKGRLIVDVANS